ncbi:DNA-processing protein DprA [Agreia sp. COWG]|uniref:DNA-processing protein DprA n=1 Tax=Agreia sp. COWG TaxID=2773266 RepID=UPI0019255E38|nr:DNA-processing protein DprA [Agreia sp. COWG]CAD5995535.1 DNA-binding protein [Agreia sp. COWG]
MTTFGLETAQISRLASAVVSRHDAVLDDAGAAEIFARASWTGIAEPGDGVAGVLVSHIGAPRALTALIEGWKPDRLGAVLIEAGGDSVSSRDLSLALDRWRPRLVSNAAISALRQAALVSSRLLLPDDPLWPQGFADLGVHAPLALWLRGVNDAVGSLGTSIALVGARAATGYGEHMAMEFGAGLSDRRICVVSGAAYGIDGMVHRAALASGGLTVAFLAGGVDRFYPSGHDALLQRISTVGAVMSELPCGSPPTKWRFLQRNRLIAASSRATVVIEAGHRSGSLNTAAHASSVGRPLGAVPGPVTSPSSAGCHRLIREFDATCVTTVDEVVELAGGLLGDSPTELDLPYAGEGDRLPPEQLRVLDALSVRAARTSIDIARRAGIATTTAEGVLGMLQLDGLATENDSGWRKTK